MVGIVVFWASFLALLFFLLGIMFKALASAFNALLAATGKIVIYGGIAALGTLAVFLLCSIISGIITDGILSVLKDIVGFAIVAGVVFFLFGAIGAAIIEVIVSVAEAIIGFISAVLEGISDFCENRYHSFLSAIMKRLDRC